jgi:hypothetical protein
MNVPHVEANHAGAIRGQETGVIAIDRYKAVPNNGFNEFNPFLVHRPSLRDANCNGAIDFHKHIIPQWFSWWPEG